MFGRFLEKNKPLTHFQAIRHKNLQTYSLGKHYRDRTAIVENENPPQARTGEDSL
jgi:hypothetical protein